MKQPRAGDLVARMNRLGARPDPAAQAAEPRGQSVGGTSVSQETPAPATTGRRRGDRDVHYTVDLPRDAHRAARIWALQHDVDLSVVIRELLALLDDQVVADLVMHRLGRTK